MILNDEMFAYNEVNLYRLVHKISDATPLFSVCLLCLFTVKEAKKGLDRWKDHPAAIVVSFFN
jgi:hypothetical protein